MRLLLLCSALLCCYLLTHSLNYSLPVQYSLTQYINIIFQTPSVPNGTHTSSERSERSRSALREFRTSARDREYRKSCRVLRAECREPCSSDEIEVQTCSPTADRVCRARASLYLAPASYSSSSPELQLGLLLSESRALVAFEEVATRRESRSATLNPNSAAARAIADGGRAFQLEPPLAHSEQLAVRVWLERVDLVPQFRAVDHSALNENAAFRAARAALGASASHANTILEYYCPFVLPSFYALSVQAVAVRVLSYLFVHLLHTFECLSVCAVVIVIVIVIVRLLSSGPNLIYFIHTRALIFVKLSIIRALERAILQCSRDSVSFNAESLSQGSTQRIFLLDSYSYSQGGNKAAGIESGRAESGPRALADSCAPPPPSASRGAPASSSGDARALRCSADELLESPYSLAYNRLLKIFPNAGTSARSSQFFNVLTHRCACAFYFIPFHSIIFNAQSE